jgi:hypothetical protein
MGTPIDHVKYQVSLDIVDEYTEDITYNDDAGVAITHTSDTVRGRHFTEVGKTLGGGVSSSSHIPLALTGIVGYGTTDGAADYGNVLGDGTHFAIGAEATAYDVMFIKHTGFEYDSGLGTTANTNKLDVFIETAANTYFKICSLNPGGAIVLPNTPALVSACTFMVARNAGSESIAVEYLVIT